MILNHHAILFDRKDKEDLSLVLDFVKKNIEHGFIGNPDVVTIQKEKLLVEDARNLREISYIIPIKEKFRHIFVSFHVATTEAQNALLKVFEEPSKFVKFYIVAPKNSLIKTLVSRLHVFDLERTIDDKKINNDFLQKSVGEKISFVEDLSTKLKDEEITKEDVINFLKQLKLSCDQNPVKYKNNLKAISCALKYMSDNSASVKQLLFLVALS